jgi:hypothetical protein
MKRPEHFPLVPLLAVIALCLAMVLVMGLLAAL